MALFSERKMSTVSGQVVAIIEREYLIAIDVERIITENFTCKTHVIMPDEALEKLPETGCNILILDADMPAEIISSFDEIVAASNPSIVLMTVSDIDPKTYFQLPYKASIAKPFTDEQVVEKLTPLLA
jgi:DNA-binding NarL/FixJ family response regulator